MDKNLFEELRQSAEEMVAIRRGEMAPAHVTCIAMPAVKEIRAKTPAKRCRA